MPAKEWLAHSRKIRESREKETKALMKELGMEDPISSTQRSKSETSQSKGDQ